MLSQATQDVLAEITAEGIQAKKASIVSPNHNFPTIENNEAKALLQSLRYEYAFVRAHALTTRIPF